MCTQNLAFSSKHPYVPNPKVDTNATRWIASLSDGTTVFEDVTPNESSAWLRLSDYVDKQKLKVTNLRLEAYGRRVLLVPYKDADGNSQVNGYWQSKRLNAILTDVGCAEGHERGIGYLKGREIIITWVGEDGTVQQDIRPYENGDPAVIVNDHP